MNITGECVHFFLSLSFTLGWVINQDDGIAARKRSKKKNGFNSFSVQNKVLFISCAFIHVFGLLLLFMFQIALNFFPTLCVVVGFPNCRCQTSFSTPDKHTLLLLSVEAIDQRKLKWVFLSYLRFSE